MIKCQKKLEAERRNWLMKEMDIETAISNCSVQLKLLKAAHWNNINKFDNTISGLGKTNISN